MYSPDHLPSKSDVPRWGFIHSDPSEKKRSPLIETCTRIIEMKHLPVRFKSRDDRETDTCTDVILPLRARVNSLSKKGTAPDVDKLKGGLTPGGKMKRRRGRRKGETVRDPK